MSDFVIREVKGNKTGSLPAHHDIHLAGDDDSIITVWAGKEMAEECVKFLEQYPERSKAGVA
ncbi:MAG: hypothetical protein ACXWP5_00380 [Bdellovibrionota bacterium]